jgi:predicted nuclease with TOPRIM domain
VKNYNKQAHEKQILYEKLKNYQCEHAEQEKRQQTMKHNHDRLQVNREQLSDSIDDYQTKIQQLQKLIQTKDKEVCFIRLNFDSNLLNRSKTMSSRFVD